METVPEGDSSSRLNRPRLLLLVMSTVTWTCSVTATCREKRIQYKCSAPDHRDGNIVCSTAGSCPRCRGGGGPLVHTVNLKTEMTTRTLKTKNILMTILSTSLYIFHYDYQACMQVISGLIAGGSFAEMSDFMPGVKVLLQVAQQQGTLLGC